MTTQPLPFDTRDLPEGWKAERLGRYFSERSEMVSDTDFEPLSVTMRGVLPQIEGVAKSADNDRRKLVRAGDIAINSRSDRKGAAGLSPRDGSVSVITTVLKPRAIDPRFAHHLLRSVPFQEEYYRNGSGIVADLWSTRWAAMRSIAIPVPPREQQALIADFLDRETAEIDAFIADQQLLIRLLAERRCAFIAHELRQDEGNERDSGWRTVRVGDLAQVINGYPFDSAKFSDSGIPLVRIRDLGSTEPAVRFAGDPVGSVIVDSSDLLVGMDGDFNVGRWLGDEPALLNQRMLALRTDRQTSGLLEYSLPAALREINELAYATTVKHLASGQVRAIRVRVPTERRLLQEVVDNLDSETSAIDDAIADARLAVDLTRERRVALISAAVTGKIEVTA